MKLSKESLDKLVLELLEWIRVSMMNSGGKKAVIGISGGKDSSVVAALCVNALGSENVIGVLMPDGVQADISFSEEICKVLKIASTTVNIEAMTSAFIKSMGEIDRGIVEETTKQTKLNLPPRVRMTLLYAISQSIDDSRVINTSNLSEDWIGYATIYGDTAGAFSPLGMLTSDEVVQIGQHIGVPSKFIYKEPSDGLTGKTDEDIFGFSYEVLNKYIRQGIIEDKEIKDKIDRMHKYSRHKFLPISMYHPGLEIGADDIANIYKKDR